MIATRNSPISIHALAKRATRDSLKLLPFSVISIHALAKRATTTDTTVNTGTQFQSTPSQRGRPHVVLSCKTSPCISIHALAKRATRAAQKNFHGDFISIHALAKRATKACLSDFKVGLISIHALAKRATFLSYSRCKTQRFQSTPSQRGRHYI